MSRRRRYVPAWPDYGGKRKRQGRAAVALLVLIVIGVAASRLGPGAPGAPEAASSSAPLALAQRDGGWFAGGPLERRADATRVSVDRVIDGDTIDVLAAQTPLRVRFYGIDTPERGKRCADEATARTAALVGSAVVLVPDARQQDRFQRELRYVFTPDGRSIDATLIAEGLALAWREDGSLREPLIALEDAAREAQRGCLWQRSPAPA